MLAIGALVVIGLLLHTSMLLFGAGLLVLPGRRRDADAWRWRGALLAGFAVWAVLWGPTFLHQASGGHSDWIARTTVSRTIDAFGRLLIDDPFWHVAVVVGVVVGAVVMWRVDPRLARVVTCCSLVPLALAALAGILAPVLLDRTLTLMAWGPMIALAFLVRATPSRRVAHSLVCLCLGLLAAVMAVSAWQSITTRTVPNRVLRHVEAVVRPGDVVALRPGGRVHLLEWTLGVRHGWRTGSITSPVFPIRLRSTSMGRDPPASRPDGCGSSTGRHLISLPSRARGARRNGTSPARACRVWSRPLPRLGRFPERTNDATARPRRFRCASGSAVRVTRTWRRRLAPAAVESQRSSSVTTGDGSRSAPCSRSPSRS